MSGWKGQLGVKKEPAYGSTQTVDHFLEPDDAGPLEPDFWRGVVDGIAVSQSGPRADRQAVMEAGHSGAISLPVLAKNFAFWLEHMLGAVTTSGPTETVVYTHTGTVGNLYSKSFTMQVGVPRWDAQTVDPFTYTGCKLTGWDLAMDAGGLLIFKPTIDAKSMVTSTGLATASYPASPVEPFGFVGGTILIGGTTTPLQTFALSYNTGVTRRDPQIGQVHPEPMAMRPTPTWSIGLEHADLVHLARVMSSTPAGAHAAITATFQTPSVLTGATTLKGKVVVTIPSARFDTGIPKLPDTGIPKATYTGVVDWDASNSMVSIAVSTLEATP